MMKAHAKEDGCYNALVAAVDIFPGEDILSVKEGKRYPQPNKYTLQIAEKDHVEVINELRYTNHECVTANAFFDFNQNPWVLKSRKFIKRGEPITYDYVTTEYKVTESFKCKCNSDQCRNFVGGFFYLNDKEKEELINNDKVLPTIIALHNENRFKENTCV